MRPRIAIAGFQHETNTFVPLPTTWEHFQSPGAWPDFSLGEEVLANNHGLNTPIGGFIDASSGFDLVPLLYAAAEPGGLVVQSAFDRIAGILLDGLQRAGEIDGLYLDLHGAMVTEEFADGEAELLRRIREVTGDDLPIAASLDLHGNLSKAFFERCSCATIYRTYPHVDMAETGARCVPLLERLLERGEPFAGAFAQLDFLVPITGQSTRREPGARLYGMLGDMAARHGVATLDFAFGFPPADIPDCGISVMAFGEEQNGVDAAVREMVQTLRQAEGEFADPLVDAGEACERSVKLAQQASRPVIICDPQDNPGAGATGETTGLLTALIAAGARDTAIGALWDPATAEAAHVAGEGAGIDVTIGGRHPQIGGPPVAARVTVEQLSDGNFLCTGPMFGGIHAKLGPMARLRLRRDGADIQVVVASKRAQNADQAFFTHIGIEPSEMAIVAVKSAVHFLADYEPIAHQVIFAKAPGANPCRLDEIEYTRLRPGVRLGPNGPAFSQPS